MRSIRRSVTTALLAGAATLAAATAAPAQSTDPTPAATDPGRVVVEWDRVARGARPYARALRRSRSVERVAAAVNDRYVLPRDIPIVFSSQIEQGPAYFPNVRIGGRRESFIHFPGSFLELEVAVMRRELRGVRELRPIRGMIHANEFVIAHELGHALVDQLDIPITGKEEDAVDGFAAYLLANTRGFGVRSALSAAVLFDGLSSPDAPTDADYADEHSLSQQRVYQFLCWIYGSDKRAFRGIVGPDMLPRARAVRCPAEWRQLNRSWTRLMEPHLRADALPTEPVEGGDATPPSQLIPRLEDEYAVKDLTLRMVGQPLLVTPAGHTFLRVDDAVVMAILMRDAGRTVTAATIEAEYPAIEVHPSRFRGLRSVLNGLEWGGRLEFAPGGATLVPPR